VNQRTKLGFGLCTLSVNSHLTGANDTKHMAFRHTFANAAQKVVQTLILMFFVNFEQNSPVGIGFFLCIQFFVLPIGQVQHIIRLSLGKRPKTLLDTPHRGFI
jgi:hypothetical protein